MKLIVSIIFIIFLLTVTLSLSFLGKKYTAKQTVIETNYAVHYYVRQSNKFGTYYYPSYLITTVLNDYTNIINVKCKDLGFNTIKDIKELEIIKAYKNQ
jgi:hypothetical protein